MQMTKRLENKRNYSSKKHENGNQKETKRKDTVHKMGNANTYCPLDAKHSDRKGKGVLHAGHLAFEGFL